MVHLIIIAQRRTSVVKQCPNCFRKLGINYDDLKVIVESLKTYKQAREYLYKKLEELDELGYTYEWFLFPSQYYYGFSPKGMPRKTVDIYKLTEVE